MPALVDAGCRAVELMVAPALIAASHIMPGTPKEWQELPPESAALLVEVGGGDESELGERIEAAEAALGDRELIREHAFVREHEGIELAWSVREGLFGLVGKLRLPGTALIVEDVCVAPERIAECAKDLQALLGEHGFLTGVAGHASAGNLHFQLTPAFSDPADIERYEKFMEGLVELIVDRYDGSLKSEHGTGRNMAPWVEREWGHKATEMMWRVKALADPDGVLNPDSVLSRDAGVHLSNLKTQPPIEEEVTRLRGVRLLRAGVPEPPRDHHAAPADRAAARARPPAGGLAGLRGAAGRLRARRHRDLRRRRHLRAGLPGGDRHRQGDEGVPQAASAATARSAPRCRWPSATRESSARRAPGCARARRCDPRWARARSSG